MKLDLMYTYQNKDQKKNKIMPSYKKKEQNSHFTSSLASYIFLPRKFLINTMYNV